MVTDEVVVVDKASGFHISWGAVFAGLFVALGTAILLHSLGLAAGLTAINPDSPRSLRGVGIGTGVWTIIVPLIALFVGGLVAARLAGPIDRGVAAMHGAVLWGVTTVAGVILVGTAIASAVGAGLRAGSATLGAATRAMSTSEMNIDADEMLGPINERLRQQGAPPVTSAQVQAATKDVIGRAVREGRLDREQVVGAIVSNTGLDRADAQQLAARIETQFNESAEKVKHGALAAAETTGKAMWAVFAALLLGLVSAVAGAVVGVTRRQRAATVLPVGPTPVSPGPRRIPVETTT
jgi:hypothetical protein